MNNSGFGFGFVVGRAGFNAAVIYNSCLLLLFVFTVPAYCGEFETGLIEAIINGNAGKLQKLLHRELKIRGFVKSIDPKKYYPPEERPRGRPPSQRSLRNLKEDGGEEDSRIERLLTYEDKYFTPLQLAAHYSTPDVIQVLINAGADQNQTVTIDMIRDSDLSVPALGVAISQNKLDNVKVLLLNREDDGCIDGGNYECFRPFTYLTSDSDIKIFVLLLNHYKKDVESDSLEEPLYPLEYAAESPHLFDSLVTHGADENTVNAFFRSVLFYALGREDKPKVAALLSLERLSKAKINVPDRFSRYHGMNTLLHMTARNGDMEATEWLISHGADLSALNKKNETPLMVTWASSRDRRDMIELLCSTLSSVGTPHAQDIGIASKRGYLVSLQSWAKSAVIKNYSRESVANVLPVHVLNGTYGIKSAP